MDGYGELLITTNSSVRSTTSVPHLFKIKNYISNERLQLESTQYENTLYQAPALKFRGSPIQTGSFVFVLFYHTSM